MCAINGILSLGPRLGEEDRAVSRRMLEVMRHRGPDGQRVVEKGRCLLGNARLSIQDLSENAMLPMSNEDGTVWITYNGEITNFEELKVRFDLKNFRRFRSSGDTEVLLHLYEKLGIGFMNHLSGMFAFCLYDSRIQKAFLVRDFYGMRPVFYTQRAGKLYFASEIKALLEVPGLDASLDEQGLFDFFSLAYIPGERTAFRDIRELDGGRMLEVDLRENRIEEKTYYSLEYKTKEGLSEEQTAETILDLLRDSVERNMRADVPVGLTLSGGIDTSSLLVLAREKRAEVHTFSIKMDEPSFDESYYQRLMSRRVGSVHHEINVGPCEVLENLIEPVAYMDEPSGDGAIIPLFLLARHAKRHVKVLLLGEGGDEVFSAYETHRAYKARKLYRRWVPSGFRRLARGAAQLMPASYKKLSFDFIAKRFTQGAERDVPEAHLYWRHAVADSDKRALLPGMAGLRDTEVLFREMFDNLDLDDDLNRISLLDLKYYFIGDLMVKNDRMLMAHSIEARFPYMDRPLVEFASTIPPNMRVKGFQGRYIQKLAMKGLLPEEIAGRTNMGLEMPHSMWFGDHFFHTAKRYFSKENVGRTDLLDPGAVDRLWTEHLSGKVDNGRALWCILNFLVWFDLFVYNRDYKDYIR